METSPISDLKVIQKNISILVFVLCVLARIENIQGTDEHIEPPWTKGTPILPSLVMPF